MIHKTTCVLIWIAIACLTLAVSVDQLFAQRGRGGGTRGGGGRSVSRPSASRPSAARPAASRPSASRPSSRPSLSSAARTPARHPSSSRPSMGGIGARPSSAEHEALFSLAHCPAFHTPLDPTRSTTINFPHPFTTRSTKPGGHQQRIAHASWHPTQYPTSSQSPWRCG